jgi:hypothetical protein
MELNLWQTLLISASGGVIGGLVAQILSFGVELLRWRREDRIRRQQWARDDAVQRRDALRDVYERLFGSSTKRSTQPRSSVAQSYSVMPSATLTPCS